MKNNINTLNKTERFPEGSGMVRGYFPSKAGVSEMLKKQRNGTVRIFYGESYDMLGVTIDSLKYYLFLALLHKNLEESGVSVESVVLIADTASTINSSSGDTNTVLAEGKRRLEILHKIIDIYSLPIKVQLMSEIFREDSVQELIQKVQNVVSESTDIQLMLQKTVLQNRIHQENKVAYRYGAEAVATALLYDLKIGPPRERFYDEAAVVIAKKLNINCYRSIYLTPTYPLGLDFVYFLMHPEVEEYGLTPYKAGSNKLEDNRIILGRSSLERVYELIDTSFFSKKAGLPDPVGELIGTAKLAGLFLGKHALGDAQELYKKFIHEPLKEGGL